MKISVILPTYNEREAIVQHASQVSQVLGEAGYDHEILVVDDNSPDGTALVARRASQANPKIKVIVRKSNPGLGLSIGEGITRAEGEIIVGMDSDGNHDPNDIPKLIRRLKGSTKLVVASRFHSQTKLEGWRMLPTLAFNAFFRLFGLPIWDNTSGYYAARRRDLVELGLRRIYFGYGDYHLRLVYFAHLAGWRIVEVPTRYLARLGGESKSRLLQMAIDYTRVVWNLRRGK